MDMSYSYDMENGFGDYVTIIVRNDGSAECVVTDWNNVTDAIQFDSEDDAYDWAYRRGYRE